MNADFNIYFVYYFEDPSSEKKLNLCFCLYYIDELTALAYKQYL